MFGDRYWNFKQVNVHSYNREPDLLTDFLLKAPLRYELGDGHTYDYVEGMFPYELASG